MQDVWLLERISTQITLHRFRELNQLVTPSIGEPRLKQIETNEPNNQEGKSFRNVNRGGGI